MTSKGFGGITEPTLRAVVRDAVKRGWTAEWTGKNHIRLTHPSGAIVFCAGTPHTAVAARKTESRLRRVEREAVQ